MIEEEFSIKFDTLGRPTDFHVKKKKWMQQTKSEKNSSLDQQFSDEMLSCDSNYELVNIEHYKYNKKVQPEKKSSKNVLFAVMLSLLTLIICHYGLKQKIKQKHFVTYIVYASATSLVCSSWQCQYSNFSNSRSIHGNEDASDWI